MVPQPRQVSEAKVQILNLVLFDKFHYGFSISHLQLPQAHTSAEFTDGPGASRSIRGTKPAKEERDRAALHHRGTIYCIPPTALVIVNSYGRKKTFDRNHCPGQSIYVHRGATKTEAIWQCLSSGKERSTFQQYVVLCCCLFIELQLRIPVLEVPFRQTGSADIRSAKEKDGPLSYTFHCR